MKFGYKITLCYRLPFNTVGIKKKNKIANKENTYNINVIIKYILKIALVNRFFFS